MGMERRVAEAIEREDRVFIRFPRKKRTLRILVSYLEIESFATEEDPHKADTFDVPCTESSSNPTGNIKRCSLGLPPATGQQPKKRRRMANGRFEAEASSSGTRDPTPEWLVQLMRDKKGKDPRCIIKKALVETDVLPHFRRLSMPFSKIEDLEFLTPSEENIIRRHARKLRDDGLASILVASDLKEYKVKLARWNMGKNPPYFLTSGWNHVVSDYQLQTHDKICLWSFHVGKTLYFAMVPTSQTESGESGQDELCVSNQRQN
ncbi:PREDICTED: B3 domain-containing protein At2g24670-like [Camelina sativa]|uniref:B3 domain-containing protein At2g24670-like n=1 Tax=Camelina sativa TaxID=90675 RepID=A0ABM0VXK5_CAMSA|nr:PREDICTED: B3 domain-containing protein At2g24670-like [Camelina sativa]